ncbi:unnamed protein product [Pleuronectes platessa]|uniref:Uncharacterized protein n=1 Tax=Pleuronectes platessa TaxID=8262 RepID=A0A9N7VYZ1_PLEPL|nr:unnamed protein product [Pleuronectes platessa]
MKTEGNFAGCPRTEPNQSQPAHTTRSLPAPPAEPPLTGEQPLDPPLRSRQAAEGLQTMLSLMQESGFTTDSGRLSVWLSCVR